MKYFAYGSNMLEQWLTRRGQAAFYNRKVSEATKQDDADKSEEPWRINQGSRSRSA